MPCSRERGDRRAQLAGPDRVDADGGLVEEEHVGVVQQAAGDVEPLPHAARVALDPLALATGQADQLEQPPMRAFCSRGGHAVELGEVAQVVERRRAARRGRGRRRRRSRSGAAPRGRPRPRRGRARVALPEVGSSRVISILIVVVLPAPLGPSRPKSSPGAISKLTPFTASTVLRCGRSTPCLVRNERCRSRATTAAGSWGSGTRGTLPITRGSGLLISRARVRSRMRSSIRRRMRRRPAGTAP